MPVGPAETAPDAPARGAQSLFALSSLKGKKERPIYGLIEDSTGRIHTGTKCSGVESSKLAWRRGKPKFRRQADYYPLVHDEGFLLECIMPKAWHRCDLSKGGRPPWLGHIVVARQFFC